MTTRRYYDDAYTTEFTASAMARIPIGDDKLGIVLDQTYFYPSSGGQPHDTGWIQGIPVSDVMIDGEGQTIVHVVAGDPKEDMIHATINWERRFDHMQHHTGQHILSQAFVQVASANTVGFHLSANSATIDLDLATVTTEQLVETARLANQIIWQNRPVRIHQVTLAEAALMSVRKLPAGHKDQVRLIEIADFDCTACGGTHVAHTGEVGLIKIAKLEKRRNQVRVHFLCGQRALADYDCKDEVINELTSAFSTSYKELVAATQQLRNELKSAHKQLKQQQVRLVKIEAQELLTQGQIAGELTFVNQVFADRDIIELRALARQLIAHPGTVVLLGLAGSRCHLLLARAPDVPVDMKAHLQSALHLLDAKSGGGTSAMAQGGGVPAGETRVAAVLAQIEDEIRVAAS